MAMPEMVGHLEARAALGHAAHAGTLAQSILLHGPAGAGKERLGLWTAQTLVCERGGAEPCRACPPCRLVDRLEHPDVHWFFPLPRPDAASPEKLREKLEEARAAELQLWRTDPFRTREFDRPPAHFLAAVRTIQQLASVRPALGRRKVFVVGDAELMVPQESSPEAANAFLKLLEEPPRETTLILTSSHPGALLPTIRSRVLSLRVGPPTMPELAALLAASGRAGEAEAAEIARRARGSARRAFRILQAGGKEAGDPDAAAGRQLLVAALSSGALPRLAAAHDRRPAGARNELVGALDSLAEWLRDLLAVVAGAPESVSDHAALPILKRAAEQRRMSPAGVTRAIERVGRARELAQGNVNPQLIVADLLRSIQQDLQPPSRRPASAVS